MKLWLLTVREDLADGILWNDYRNECPDCHVTYEPESYIIRAETPKAARRLAAGKLSNDMEKAWLNPEFTHCVEIPIDGKEEILG